MRSSAISLVLAASFATACGGDPPPPPVAPAPTVAVTPPPEPTPAPTPEPAPAPKPSMAELQMKNLKNQVATVGDAKAYAANFAADGVDVIAGMPEMKGRDAIQAGQQMFVDGFPDMKMGMSRVFQKGNVAIVEWVVTGTQSKDFMGVKASNKPVGISGVSVEWFNDDGLVKETHEYFDLGTVMAQIGGSKQKARAPMALPTSTETHVAKGTPEEDKNLEAIKTTYAAMDTKKEADFLGVMDDAIEYDDMTQPASMKGKAEAKKFFGMWTKAFPDQKNTVVNGWGFDEYVVSEFNTKGTHKGPIGPIKATNKPVDLHGVDVFKVSNGKLTRGWTYANGAELMTEIGMMPKMGDAPKPAAAPAGAKPTPAATAKPAAAVGAKPAPAAPAAAKPKP